MATKLKLFHFEVYLPRVIKTRDASRRVELVDDEFSCRPRYGSHALEAAANDRYGDVRHLLPRHFRAADAQLVEVEADLGSWEVTKRVFRMPLDAERDICLVIQADGFVRTVWINLRSDEHRTLQREKYEQPPKRG